MALTTFEMAAIVRIESFRDQFHFHLNIFFQIENASDEKRASPISHTKDSCLCISDRYASIFIFCSLYI